jgi:glyoxylase-like metal-dependent hydrolase (beta-lactamase superfamily II)
MTDFVEVADRVWVGRYPWCDVTITALGSDRGLVVVDTHSSTRAAEEVVADLRRLGAGEVVAVVNTHEHFDHVFGNAAFRAAYGPVPIHAHEVAAANTPAAAERVKQNYLADLTDGHRDEIAETEVVAADHTFSSVRVLDLGDRAVELVHPGRGHTAGDLVVGVPDVGVLLAGDLVEESAKPWIGGDAFPFDWPATLDVVLSMTTAATVIVPGHGAPVDRDFVEEQRNELGIIAETIRDLAGRGVPLDRALETGEWPWEPRLLEDAVRRGYEQLPRGGRQLPLA